MIFIEAIFSYWTTLSWVAWRISWWFVYCMHKTPKKMHLPYIWKCWGCTVYITAWYISEHYLTCFCNYQEQNNNADWATRLQNLKYLWSWTNTKGWICIVWVTVINRIIKLPDRIRSDVKNLINPSNNENKTFIIWYNTNFCWTLEEINS